MQVFPSHSDAQVVNALDISRSCRWCGLLSHEGQRSMSLCEHMSCECVFPKDIFPIYTENIPENLL